MKDCGTPKVVEIKCPGEVTLFHKVTVPAEMGDEETNPPKQGAYKNTLLVYEATGAAFLYSSDGIYTFLAERGPAGPPGKDGKDGADGFSPDATVTQTQTGATITITDKDGTTTATVYNGKDIERIIFYANSAESGATRHLYKDNTFTTAATAQDLLDATVAGAPSVHFISSSDPNNYNEAFIQNAFVNPDNQDFEFVFMDDRSTFNYSATALTDAIFSYYKSDFQAKLTAGSNIQINGATISATDTTYSNFTGATPSVAGANGLVPAPTTSDPDKYLKGDGTWGTPTNTTYTAGTNVQISAQNVISATDTTYTHFTGATSSADGTAGLVPAPIAGDESKFLKADGTWATVSGGASRYDASWLMSQQVATQTQYDELRAAIAAGDIIYAGASNEILVATYYGAPVGSAFAYFSYDEIYSNNGNTSTTVVAMAFNVDGTTLAITPLGDTTTIPKSVPTKTSDLTNDSGFITSSSLPGDMTGATSGTAGAHGLVPAPAAGDEGKFLSGAGTWMTVTSGGSYSAGNGISIDANNEISIDTSVVAEVGDIPTRTSDLVNDGSDNTSVYVEADELATVATSGSYNDLLNTPTIPAAQVNADWNANSGVAEILNKPSLATVATSGSYNDLLNQPTIPAAQIQSDWTQADNTKLDYIKNKPTIPTVNDGTLTITQNGTSAGTFSANASAATTIALTDTTYSAFTGTDGVSAGTAGLVPAPATTDANKFLNSDGSWTAVSAGSSTITGTGAPTSSTAAEVGQFYLDTQTGNTYVCTDDTGGTYTWDTVGGGVSLTMTTTDPGEGSALAANTILGVYDGGGVTMDYSTSEQATGYTWIDGSMIYKKTVNFGALPNSTAKLVAHSITSLGKFIKLEGYGRKTNGATYPLPYASAGSGSIELYADNTNIEITTTNDRTDISECYVTLYYTKSA